MNIPLGLSVPANTPHAISVSLPTWRDNVGYEEGEKRVVDSMTTGYPRFFIHLTIAKLASLCEQKYAIGNERCMLFATKKVAEHCRSFIQRRCAERDPPSSVTARIVHLFICPDDDNPDAPAGKDSNGRKWDRNSIAGSCANLHIVLFPETAFSVAKEFWQHTGLGVSSRLAEKCLNLLSSSGSPLTTASSSPPRPASPMSSRYAPKGRNNIHYSAVKPSSRCRSGSVTAPLPTSLNGKVVSTNAAPREDFGQDHSIYLEERYGRNLPLSAAYFAKKVLRSRIAGVLRENGQGDQQQQLQADKVELDIGPSVRGVKEVSADDVYLYPCGMAAIWSAHNLALAVRPPAKSVCFGFPYTDTLKILQKWGPGCHFLGFGIDSDIDDLERILESEARANPDTPPILALFTEFPSNPLLRSANLPRLKALADKYDFLIVIDETIGNYCNVEVLPYADILVSSLTKVFSGASNVMGGGFILNPRGRHYAALKAHLDATFEDLYFDEDAIYMERNSRDFKRRVRVIDNNAEAICDLLHSRSLSLSSSPSSTSSFAVKQVFYPKYITRENYETCRRKGNSSPNPQSPCSEGGGFGGLFSLTFTSLAASKAFFDALPCSKGPSLGTNFTLACPFTILAHYGELDWAGMFGVEEGLVRVSVGMEDTKVLLEGFEKALGVAEEVVAKRVDVASDMKANI